MQRLAEFDNTNRALRTLLRSQQSKEVVFINRIRIWVYCIGSNLCFCHLENYYFILKLMNVCLIILERICHIADLRSVTALC